MVNLFEKVFGVIKVKDLMRSPAITIGETEDLSWAIVKFKNHSISHLVVINDEEAVVGILSPKYIYRTQSPRKIMGQDTTYTSDMVLDGDAYFHKETLNQYAVRHVMKKHPPTIRPGLPIVDVIKMMAKRKLGSIPVVDKDMRALGIITEREIIEYAAKMLE